MTNWYYIHISFSPPVDFDIIGQLENYKEDEEFIIKNLKLDIKLGVHKNMLAYPEKKSTHEKRIEFFENIPQELTAKLYRVYKLDFDMFGYEKPIIWIS